MEEGRNGAGPAGVGELRNLVGNFDRKRLSIKFWSESTTISLNRFYKLLDYESLPRSFICTREKWTKRSRVDYPSKIETKSSSLIVLIVTLSDHSPKPKKNFPF